MITYTLLPGTYAFPVDLASWLHLRLCAIMFYYVYAFTLFLSTLYDCGFTLGPNIFVIYKLHVA